MASARKKQDEKNLKTLRELGALPQNKYCFECNQRGPTYVDITIGSFVCTKCSGMLRGITPPHRIKSISMATFTGEEIEYVRGRGNDYCRQVWLGLYEGGAPPTDSRDEQAIRDFMVNKYERKRFYLEPSQAQLRNGHSKIQEVKPLASLLHGNESRGPKVNGTAAGTEFNRKRPEAPKFTGFANFDKIEAFSTSANNNQTQQNKQPLQQQQQQQQPSFANFDDNPVFNNNMTVDEFSIFDLNFTNSGPVLNQVPLFPKCNTNRWSMPTPATFDNMNLAQTSFQSTVPAPPREDKYAALKDLDNAIKSQTQLDWNSSGSNGSLYSSSTPTGSMYSSPSPQSSMFGSPSQGQFTNGFPDNNGFPNPFGSGASTNGAMPWGVVNGNGFAGAQPYANPFRDPIKANGFSHNFQPAVFPVAANGACGANPFKVGGTASVNTNNPFL